MSKGLCVHFSQPARVFPLQQMLMVCEQHNKKELMISLGVSQSVTSLGIDDKSWSVTSSASPITHWVAVVLGGVVRCHVKLLNL